MGVLVEPPSSPDGPHTITVPDTVADHDLLDELSDALKKAPGDAIVWLPAVTEPRDELMSSAGWSGYRDLYQLRRSLPAEAADLAERSLDVRAFEDHDAGALISVNNRAFDWHPEQRGMTRQRLDQLMAESWFDADGLRLLYRDGEPELVGFCWTKIHHDSSPPVGEIFVIGVDPAHHEQGLGRPLTLAGLEWLAQRGLTTAMLYVESDNHPALALYERLGFRHSQTNRAYRREFS